MKILEKEGITFDDVLLVPQYSTLISRADADTSTQIGNLKLKIPIITSNMDSITGLEMALAMGKLGGAGILHRFEKMETIVEWLKQLHYNNYPGIPSIGVKEEDLDKAYKYRAYTDVICLDLAHGHSKVAIDQLRKLRQFNYKTIIAGNVATHKAACEIGHYVNVIKVGIGPGSVCETRGVTGHGVPQLTAIYDCYQGAEWARLADGKFVRPSIIADGGMNSSGDIVKALAMGADAIMTGSLVAGTAECNMPTIYRGMASTEAQMAWLGKVNNGAAEGMQQTVSAKGPVSKVIERLVGGIRSGMSYSGVHSLKELQDKAIFMKVTPSTVRENNTRKI